MMKGRIDNVNGQPVVRRGQAQFKPYTLRNAYRDGGLRYDNDVTEGLFGEIIRQYFDEVIDYMFKYSKYIFPYRLGKIYVMQFCTEPSYNIHTGEIKAFRSIDNKATRQLWCNDEDAKKNKIFVYRPIRKMTTYIKFDGYNNRKYKSKLRFFVFKKSRNLRTILGDLIKKGECNTIYKSDRL